jgi:hypothetical protein
MLAYKRTVVSRRVIVNLTTGTAFSAILWAKRGPLLVLRDAQLLEAGRQPVNLDGEVVVERSRVEYIQALPEVVA